jgi:arsenite methyltransferase
MLSLAEKNKARFGAHNVEFLRARITDIPLDSNIADVIISNCVINLVPEDDKPLVFKEIFRLLKPGGRVAVSDILAKKALPERLRKCATAYVGCIAGASLLSQYHRYFQEAGFAGVSEPPQRWKLAIKSLTPGPTDVLIEDTKNDLNVYIDPSPEGMGREKGGEGVDRQESPLCEAAPAPNTSSVEASCCGCCAAGKDMGQNLDLSDMVAELGQIDLNEWVGEC